MLSPIITMFKHFPLRAVITVLIMAVISIYAFKRIKYRYDNGDFSKRRGLLLWMLINYIILLLFFAVFGRRSMDYYRYNFEIGYSYLEVFSTYDSALALQIAANIAVFIPVGFMGSLVSKRHGFIKGLLLGILVSLCIEILQLVLRNGYCEIDDLISNSLGTILGCAIVEIYRLLRYLKSLSVRKR